MGLPPVVVGLFVFLLLARSGPLGDLELLYTPWAMILAQVIIATPLVVGVTLAAIQGLDEQATVPDAARRGVVVAHDARKPTTRTFLMSSRVRRFGILASSTPPP